MFAGSDSCPRKSSNPFYFERLRMQSQWHSAVLALFHPAAPPFDLLFIRPLRLSITAFVFNRSLSSAALNYG